MIGKSILLFKLALMCALVFPIAVLVGTVHWYYEFVDFLMDDPDEP